MLYNPRQNDISRKEAAMDEELQLARQQVNFARYRAGQVDGHYESFFQRANHPSRPLAFWIRYTVFSPKGRPQDALGELWAIYFDGESGQHVAVKNEFALMQCHFDPDKFSVEVADAWLKPGRLEGAVVSNGGSIAWDLSFRGEADPLFMFPLRMYKTKLPSAKSLVSLPMATYEGSLAVNGQKIEVTDWVGSQNHNWGRKHTDHYAWGQVAGFDTHPDSFLEVASVQLKFGPVWTPLLTPLVLRHQGEEFALNSPIQFLRAKASFDYFTWNFRSDNQAVRIEGKISAPREAFVGLTYYNPPGGNKHCLNTKIASCELKLTRKPNGKPETLSTQSRAAFEILTDDSRHGVEMRV
jgi:hypothetical protein